LYFLYRPWEVPSVVKQLEIDANANDPTQMSFASEEDIQTHREPEFCELFSIRYRKAVVTANVITLLVQFSGSNSVLFYSTYFFDKHKSTHALSVYITQLISFGACLFVITSFLIIDRVDRKRIMILGAILLACVNILLAIVIVSQAPAFTYLIMFFMYLPIFNMTLGPVLWVYFSETLTSNGMGIAVMFNWITIGILSIII
jgi:MFS family permease